MQRRAVGHSGLQVSRLGLGTLTWGRETRLEDATGLLRCFVEGGGSLIDTAAAYAAGDAERMIGRLLRGFVRGRPILGAGIAAYPGERHRSGDTYDRGGDRDRLGFAGGGRRSFDQFGRQGACRKQ